MDFFIDEIKMFEFNKKCIELGVDATKYKKKFDKKHGDMIKYLTPKDFKTYINAWVDVFIKTGRF